MSETKGLTNDLLKSKMPDAMVYRGTFLDIDSLFTPGIYSGGALDSSGTFPSSAGTWKYGTLEVIKGRSPRITQRLTSDIGNVAVRVWNSGWQDWKQML